MALWGSKIVFFLFILFLWYLCCLFCAATRCYFRSGNQCRDWGRRLS